MHCALAAETKLETPEGAITIKGIATKAAPVFTVENDRHRFRMALDARLLAEAQPVVRVTLATGASFRAGADQVCFKKDGSEARVGDLTPGDTLEPLHTYIEGYEYRDDESGDTVACDATVAVASVEPAGEADIYSLRVNKTGTFFVAAGVLCKAEGA